MNEIIKLIKDDQLKNLVDGVIEHSRSILSLPASYCAHPDDERGFDGLLIHSLRTVVMSLCVTKRLYHEFINFNSMIIDLIITNALLHDLPFKYEYSEDDKQYKYNKYHASDNACFIALSCKKLKLDSIEKMITYPIYYHMGRFSCERSEIKNMFKKRNDVDIDILIRILQEGDYLASREYIKTNCNIYIIKNLISDLLYEVS